MAVCARRAERLEALAAAIERAGGRAIAVAADLTVESEARDFIARADAELGGLHALLNCAGRLHAGSVEGADTSGWRRMIDVNLLGPLYCIQAAIPLMRERGDGHIVNVSSVVGRHPIPDWAVYCATKAGITALSAALRAELLRLGIRVTVIEPGFTRTEMLEAEDVEPVVERLTKERGTGLMLPEDVAEAIAGALEAPQRLTVEDVVMRPFRRE